MTLNLNRKTLFLLLLQIQCLLHYTCLRISAIQLYTKQLLKPNFSKWGITTSRYEIKYRTAKTNSNGSRNILDPRKEWDDCWHPNIFWQAVPSKKTEEGILLIYSEEKKEPFLKFIDSKVPLYLWKFAPSLRKTSLMVLTVCWCSEKQLWENHPFLKDMLCMWHPY